MPETGDSGTRRNMGDIIMQIPRYIFAVLTLCYMIILFITSTAPLEGTGISRLPDGSDKIFHAIMYGVLSILVLLAMDCIRRECGKKHILTAFFVSFSYGFLMEAFQYFLPNRTFSIGDIAANGLGAVLAILLFLGFHGFLNCD